jgi:hypothetical protein
VSVSVVNVNTTAVRTPVAVPLTLKPIGASMVSVSMLAPSRTFTPASFRTVRLSPHAHIISVIAATRISSSS